MNIIFDRYSVRSFTPDLVKDDMIESLLKAAMQAPTASNRQPWHFVVIKDRKVLSKIADIHPYASMVKEAPLAIVVCGDTSLSSIDGYWVQDCSAATQNILLQAVHLGLGGCWCGIYPKKERVEEFIALLKLPSHVIPLSVIPLGHPSGIPMPKNRFNPQRIHTDSWANNKKSPEHDAPGNDTG